MYFITICVQDRRKLLSRIVTHDNLTAPKVELSAYGKIVVTEIEETPDHYPGVMVDKYVVMPDHVHLILQLGAESAPKVMHPMPLLSNTAESEQTLHPATAMLPKIIAMLKKKTNKACGIKLWQTSFHDHVIRDEDDYQNAWEYIDTNPLRWVKTHHHAEEKSA